MRWDRFVESFRTMGLERTRRALALLPLAAFVLLYGILALLLEPAWSPAFAGLALCYLIGFVALGSEWFWARWYCVGLGWSGVMVGIFGMVSVGFVSPLVIYATMHGTIVLLLKGKSLSGLYEGQTAWRTRFELDDHGVIRVGKTVSRTSASLPALVIWALGPKQPTQLLAVAITSKSLSEWAVLAALVVAMFGIFALVRGRALGACLVVAAAGIAIVCLPTALPASVSSNQIAVTGLFAGAVLAAPLALLGAVLPLFRPLRNFLRGR